MSKNSGVQIMGQIYTVPVAEAFQSEIKRYINSHLLEDLIKVSALEYLDYAEKQVSAKPGV